MARALVVVLAACFAAPLTAEEGPPVPPVFKPGAPIDQLPMDTPEQRTELLRLLYGRLVTAGTEQESAPIAEAIERLWLYSGSDTISLLMERASKAASEKNLKLALDLLDAVTELAPDYAEGWNRRAYVLYMANDFQRALGDLRRVLALDPNHYKALDGLGAILREIGEKKAALKAFQQLQGVHPNWPNIKNAVPELRREVEGQGI